MKFKIPLFLKFAVIMILIVVTPLVFVGVRTVNINRDALQASILELHTQLAKSYSGKVDFYLKEIQNEIPYITKIFSAHEVTYDTINAVLRTIVDTHENIVSISLVDAEGKEKTKVYNPKLVQEPKLLDLKSHQTFNLFKQNKLDCAISKLYYSDEEKKDARLDLFFKINPNITVYIIVTLRELLNELYKIHIGKTGYAFLVDDAGKIIAHKDKSQLFTSPEISIIKCAITATTVGSSEYKDPSGIELVGSYAPIKTLKMAVIVHQQKKEAYYSSIIMRRQAIYLIIISILLSAIIALALAKNLTRPILALIKAAGKIAQRDFTAKVELKTNDELNDLIHTFNNMTVELKKYDDMQIDKLIAEKTKTEAIIFSIADGIIMTDHKGEILLLNR
ncbi:MAG: cache domain-containing protein, partial [Elusimicrobiota bacterium]|nr:cache domain-containing protein [Elusimicrobiota bacterium]